MDGKTFFVGFCIGVLIAAMVVPIFMELSARADEMVNGSIFVCDMSIMKLRLRSLYNYFDKYIDYIDKINKRSIFIDLYSDNSRLEKFNALILFANRTVCGIYMRNDMFVFDPLRLTKDSKGNEMIEIDKETIIPTPIIFDFNRDIHENTEEYLSAVFDDLVKEYNATLRLKGDLCPSLISESDFGIVAYYISHDFIIEDFIL